MKYNFLLLMLLIFLSLLQAETISGSPSNENPQSCDFDVDKMLKIVK